MLELKNLVFEVPADDGGTKRIIDDLSLTIPDDRFTVITGPNGGGKSTLAKLIMGIEEPTSGQILFNGEDITDKSITERARLGKEKSKVEADIDFVMKKLNNPKFVDKAPEKVVAAEREKAEKLREHLAKLEESIAALN